MLTLQDIKVAREIISKGVKKTPLVHSKYLSSYCSGTVYLKLENQQITNSFKIRGALNRMSHLSPAEKKGVVTASSGNHAQAVARVAELLSIPAKIIVPKNTSKAKLSKIEKYNAEILLYGDYDEVESKAREVAAKEGLKYISPYNDEGIIAGQGTVGLEILEDLPNVEIIIVPVGGGGLISGIGIAAKSINPNIKVVGVQSKAAPTVHESLKAGKIVWVKEGESFAEGLLGGIEQEAITFEMIRQYVDDLLVVEEDTIRKAVKLLWENDKQVAEGAGAIAIAPLLENKEKYEGKTVVSVISGGNIEENLFQKIISGK